jgi:hypothetical protein
MDAQSRKDGGVSERCRLYLISPPRLELESFADTLRKALGGEIR